MAVDDAGHLINPLIVEGQIQGGLAQGIGQALIEEVVYNEDGQLVTGSFMDYALAARDRLPRFEIEHHGDADAGEPAGRERLTARPARSARRRHRHAAVDALSEFGVKHIDMMLRPEKLWRIIQGGRA